MTGTTQRLFARLAFALALLALAPACGGGSISFDAFRAARTMTADLGELEEAAANLTRGLTDALGAPADSPDAALDRLERYVSDNVETMNEVAAAIAERIDALDPADRASYLEAVSDFFAEPTFDWWDTHAEFVDAHPNHVERLETVLEPLEQRMPPG